MAGKARDSEIRFWSKVQETDGCWIWLGAKEPKGYGRFGVGPRALRAYPAHRYAYERLVGVDLPPEVHLDHLCRTPSCVNPAHLEPVTNQENVRRHWAAVTMCAKGLHVLKPGPTGSGRGDKFCVECRKEWRRTHEREKVRQRWAEDPEFAEHRRQLHREWWARKRQT